MIGRKADLRAQAEDWLRLTRRDVTKMQMEDVQDLVYELQVHQIELQIQNEELRRTQNELEVSRDKYCNLFDFAPVGYLTLDEKSTIVEANIMAATQLGTPRETLLGMPLTSFISPDSQDAFYLHNRKVMASPEPQTCELELRSDNGKKTYIQLRCLKNSWESGYCLSALTDITAHKILEEDLKQSRDEALEATQAKSQFLANMSHEIRTPLNAIVGIGNILVKDNSLTDAQQEQLKVQKSSADLLLHLINELLDISKIETCGMELEQVDFDLADLLEETALMLQHRAEEKGIALETDFSGLQPIAYRGDPMRIRQVVTNLLSNAIKFTEEGNVSLRAKSETTSDDKADVIITVSDTGIGIPCEKLENMFEPFTQADASTSRKFGGTGLGLAICRQLVEKMDGTILLASEEEKGSTFTLRLPLETSSDIGSKTDSKIATSFCVPAKPCDPAEKPLILLVEDHPPNVLIAKIYLDNFPCNYDVVSSGYGAVDAFENRSYSVILMDVQMQGMDGFEATQRIRTLEKRRNLPPIPIIAMTAHALRGDREKCLAAGMNDYLTKPFEPEEFHSKLETHIRSLTNCA